MRRVTQTALEAADRVEFLGMQGMEALVASCALLLALGSFLYTWRREGRLEKSAAYVALELASIDVFKYKAAHFDAIGWARGGGNPRRKSHAQLKEEADCFFYQCLNLFEVASRFRRQNIIVSEVYASWVAWFYETLEFPYFREQWAQEYRDNYTRELRDIFDAGLALDWSHQDDNLRRTHFYQAVGHVLKCKSIQSWRVELPEPAETPEPATEPNRVASDAKAAAALPDGMSMVWDQGEAAAEAAAFAAANIGAQASYISHGEIQTGLSADGKSWIGNLEERYREDFANPGDSREMLIVRRQDGRIAAIGIIAWENQGELHYGTIEDLAVDPTLRGSGIGAFMVDQLTERLRGRGCTWAFLESGLGNEGAHRLFERKGFRMTSHVFGQQL